MILYNARTLSQKFMTYIVNVQDINKLFHMLKIINSGIKKIFT